MKNLNSIQFEKSIKNNRIMLFISIIFLIGTLVLIYFGIENANKELPNAVSMNNLIADKKDDENIYAYVDVSTKPFLFAVYETDGVEDDSKFYFVMDSNNYLYILYMNESDFSKLNVDNLKENPIRVAGITKKIKSDIKSLAISTYNEEMKSEYLTDENFKDYVGLIYLDISTNINDSSLYYIFAFISFVFFFIFIIVYLSVYFKNRKIFKKFSKEELERIGLELFQIKENNPYEKMKLYLLKDYVVDTSNGIVILKYQDIIWAYPYEYRYNGLLVNKNIKLYDKNKKVYDISNTKYHDKDRDKIINEVLNKIKDKNPQIILGFNRENKKLFKEKLKNNK